MDPYSSGEEHIIKTRKPYTITKQRERWTEEEHSRFIEALKLYGRAWQRIEEHIGTKTAVQIRSHAQKFFTKLEKEALAKGVPIKQALDIEIPPPRPKRKPANPYPRKTGLGTPQVAAKDGIQATSVSSSHSGKPMLNLEKELISEKTCGGEKLDSAKTDEEEEKCNEALSLFQEAPCVSVSSAFENSISRPVKAVDPCTFTEFVPVLKEVIRHDETMESYITVETKEHHNLDEHDFKQTDTTSSTLIFGDCHTLHENLVDGQHTEKLSQPVNHGASSINDIRGPQNYPRHVPVHIIDGNQEMNAKENGPPETSFQESTLNHMGEGHEHPNQYANIAASANSMHHNNASRSSMYQAVPGFHPLFGLVLDNQEDYRSFLHTSSTLSDLIVSSLLQNPAAHAAASFIAAFWPNANMEASSGDPLARDYPLTYLNTPAPSMAAIAAATVAAATAWWAAHGLLPICAPFHSGCSCTPPFASATAMDNNQAKVASNGRENTPPGDAFQEEKYDADQCQALPVEHPSFKSAASSSSEDSDGTGDVELNNAGLTVVDAEEAAPAAELHDSCKTKLRKLVDRSSCGSNTTSSSEIETDALEKHEKTEETKEPDVNLLCSDSINRRSRSSISPNESWKEVSEEGRIAFQALFSREVLPQSFSPPHEMDNKIQLNDSIEKDQNSIVKNSEAASRLNLNSKSWMTCPGQQKGTSTCALLRGEREEEERLQTMGLGTVKLKAHRTGFKPYKRCSVEARESRIASTGSQNDEKGPKRMRLEGDVST